VVVVLGVGGWWMERVRIDRDGREERKGGSQRKLEQKFFGVVKLQRMGSREKEKESQGGYVTNDKCKSVVGGLTSHK
jgi:hypothetical protein